MGARCIFLTNRRHVADRDGTVAFRTELESYGEEDESLISIMEVTGLSSIFSFHLTVVPVSELDCGGVVKTVERHLHFVPLGCSSKDRYFASLYWATRASLNR